MKGISLINKQCAQNLMVVFGCFSLFSAVKTVNASLFCPLPKDPIITQESERRIPKTSCFLLNFHYFSHAGFYLPNTNVGILYSLCSRQALTLVSVLINQSKILPLPWLGSQVWAGILTPRGHVCVAKQGWMGQSPVVRQRWRGCTASSSSKGSQTIFNNELIIHGPHSHSSSAPLRH